MTIDQILEKAITAHQEGKLEEAERLYREILEIEPTQLDANNNLGVLLQSSNRLEEAEKSYKKAIELKPDYAEAHYNLGNTLYNLKKFDEAEKSYKKAIELKPDYLGAHQNLGITFNKLGHLEKAKECYEKVIEINPNYPVSHNNLGNIQKDLGRLDEAEKSYKKAIELKPDYADTYSNLGNILKDLGRFEEAEASHRKAIELKPDSLGAHYNLGLVLYSLNQFKKAADEFLLAGFNEGQHYLLKCRFLLNDQSNFIKQLEKMLDQGQNNAVIGSLISRSNARYGLHKQNPFCNEPLNYVLKTDLTKQCDFDNIFIQATKNILNDDATFCRTQSLLTNGTQTSGNLFSQKNDLIEKMKNIIHLEIEKYRERFKDSEEGFIKNWPKSYTVKGWLINMKSGGKLSPHMHEEGWLSGSIYINVPQKKTVDSGNLVVCIDDKEEEADPNKNPKKSIDVVTGSICLFPSSLLHYTIPFEADEERTVLAFDVIPK